MTPRERFVQDVIVVAFEGGVNYWADVVQYDWEPQDSPERLVEAAIKVRKDFGTRYDGKTYGIGAAQIERGIGFIFDNGVQINQDLRREILMASIDNDAGQIDAESADAIIQAGIFGRLAFG